MTRLGVTRQADDCRALVRKRGWKLAGVYEDDDVSAYNGRERPAYRRLLEDVRRGAVQAVVAWHPDRLHRSPLDLEEFVAVVEGARCTVETVQTGQLDLSTPNGRVMARFHGAMARYESEHRAERARRKHLELAERGEDVGGGRCFGYELDRKTIRPAEAALIREAADKVLQGASIRSIATDWMRRGIVSVNGGTVWSVMVVRRMLMSARISGRRERVWIDGKRRTMGLIVNDKAAWPAIISTEKSDGLRRILGNPDRRKNGKAGSYLLTHGIAVCGNCGKALVARPRADKRRAICCASGVPHHGCGKIRTLAEPIEELVAETVLRAIDKGALARAMRGKEDSKVAHELASVEDKLTQLSREWARGEISAAERNAARSVLVNRQEQLKAQLDGARRSVGLEGLNLDERMRKVWPDLEIQRKRAIISALVDRVIVDPAVRGRNTFDPRRVRIVWKPV